MPAEITPAAADAVTGSAPCLLALDPGSDKCGFAIVTFELACSERGLIYLGDLSRAIPQLVQRYRPQFMVIGNGTAAAVVIRLLDDLNLGLEIKIGDEYGTTYEARFRYFRDHPPRGLWRLLPLSMQTPPCPVDDYAAQLIGERYLADSGIVDDRKQDDDSKGVSAIPLK